MTFSEKYGIIIIESEGKVDMKKYFEVSWYMECYPLPDKCGKQMFDSREAAEEFRWKLYREGYTVWFRPMVYDPDEEGWYEY